MVRASWRKPSKDGREPGPWNAWGGNTIESAGVEGDLVSQTSTVRPSGKRRFCVSMLSCLGSIDGTGHAVGGGGRARNTESPESEPAHGGGSSTSRCSSTMLCTVSGGSSECGKRCYGKIVRIASSIALAPTIKMVEYASAKAGALGFTWSLAIELAPFGGDVTRYRWVR